MGGCGKRQASRLRPAAADDTPSIPPPVFPGDPPGGCFHNAAYTKYKKDCNDPDLCIYDPVYISMSACDASGYSQTHWVTSKSDCVAAVQQSGGCGGGSDAGAQDVSDYDRKIVKPTIPPPMFPGDPPGGCFHNANVVTFWTPTCDDKKLCNYDPQYISSAACTASGYPQTHWVESREDCLAAVQTSGGCGKRQANRVAQGMRIG